MRRTCAIVPAAGRGVRMGGGKPKQFLELGGKPLLACTLEAMCRVPFLSDIFVMAPSDFIQAAGQIVSEWVSAPRSLQGPSITILPGGRERQDSVHAGLMHLPSDCEWVVVHDGVRPFASAGLFSSVLEGAEKIGACIAALPAVETVKRARENVVTETLVREEIWLVQTPQVFRKEVIIAAYTKALEAGWVGTDDASFVERIGLRVGIVPGERANVKMTSPEDLEWASWFLAQRSGKGL